MGGGVGARLETRVVTFCGDVVTRQGARRV
jgi:hypothetical protein